MSTALGLDNISFKVYAFFLTPNNTVIKNGIPKNVKSPRNNGILHIRYRLPQFNCYLLHWKFSPKIHFCIMALTWFSWYIPVSPPLDRVTPHGFAGKQKVSPTRITGTYINVFYTELLYILISCYGDFLRIIGFVKESHRSPTDCLHKGPVMRTSDASLMLARTNFWTNTRVTDDRRRWDAITLMWLHCNTYHNSVLGYFVPVPSYCLHQCRLINNWNFRKKSRWKWKCFMFQNPFTKPHAKGDHFVQVSVH